MRTNSVTRLIPSKAYPSREDCRLGPKTRGNIHDQDLTAMKAGTRQRWISMAMSPFSRLVRQVCVFAVLALALQATADAATAGLPEGLPELPSLTETTQHDSASGLALDGYDPVAYRIDGRAVAGDRAYEVLHQGVVWRFVSAANRAAFRDAPSIYAPAYGGFDAAAVAHGRAVDTDPRQFAIIGSRLFLFRTSENRQSFVADAALLRMADNNWSSVAQTIAR
jgi:hypothetical protein